MEAAPLKSAEGPSPPEHVAIIMDGNGRWAEARGLPRTAGHQRGAEAVRRSVEAALQEGVRYLTLFGFSSENWKRPAPEIKDLMGLLRFYLKSEVRKLNREEVRFRVIGNRNRLDEDIVTLIEGAEAATKNNRRLDLIIALSYGSRAEIAAAVQSIAEKVSTGQIIPNEISEQTVSEHLYTSDIPDPDLLIRTSGEQRISNFLLWQLAYAELVFMDKLWPDFSHDDFRDALQEFRLRDRRYGAAGG